MRLPELLVSTEWLQDHLGAPDLRLLDIRGRVLPAGEPPPHYFAHRAEYDAAHIPGALFVDWTTDITDPDSPQGMQIAQPEAFAALMSRLGIGADTAVVAYDDAGGMFAARLWWALRYYGHEAVAVLDGGWPKWQAEGRSTTADIPQVSPTTFTPRVQPALRFSVDAVQSALNNPAVRLLDVRSPEEYDGIDSRAVRSGRIPGAVNLPRGTVLNPDGTVPGPQVLRDRLQTAGITQHHDMTLVTYCNAGVSASYVMLALARAGLTNLAVYDGSWKEWANDETRPIE
ncbi:MAG: sulfurtransferase [Chloroflexota bacterium]